jgi:DNA-binding ferritin-like protein
VFLVRNIIKYRIREIEKARKEAEERGDKETARLYRDIIYPINWMLEQKFDIIKERTERINDK